MKEAPHRKSLLVLQQSFGEHLQRPLVLVPVDLLECHTLSGEECVEQILKRRTAQRFLNQRRDFAVLRQDLKEMLIAEAGHRLDRAELLRLRSTGCAEVATELRETLRRQRFESSQLSSDNADESIDALHRGNRAESVAFTQTRNQSAQLVENQLEPQLARLMNDDEQKLIGMLR